MRLCILYRKCSSPAEDEQEIKALQDAGFVYLQGRTEVKPGDLVVGRYSCWPFYKELEDEIKYLGGQLINTYAQHQYIADLKNWVADLKEMTPATWDNLQNIPDQGPFCLKGGTNSRKGLWKTHCFAPNKQAALEVHRLLSNDSLIGQQNIYIRKFEKLFTYFYDVQGMPVTKEFRFFICDGQIVSSGFYWSNFKDDLDTYPSVQEVPMSFIEEAISRIGNKARAYVLDIWIKEDGTPIVGEINDFQQSGLSDNDPVVLYKNLYQLLSKEKI